MKIDDPAPSPEALAVLPAAIARRLKVLPIRRLGGRSVLVGVSQESDIVALEQSALENDFLPVLEHMQPLALEQQLAALDEADLQNAIAQTSPSTGSVQTPVAGHLEEYLGELLEEALLRGASDIHLEPTRNDLNIRLRIDGRLLAYGRLPAEMRRAMAAQVKVLAKLPLAEKRLPLDGRLRLKETDIRVSILPMLHGESVVLRIMGQQNKLELDQLGLLPEQLAVLEEHLRHPHGLLLVCGPTGSGKSTTLYTLLRRLADGQRKLITIEDPVETQIAGVTQVEVRAPAVTFVGAIRSMLRHAPDVILVGEIRDAETVAAATEAALSGHMVLASVHARDCAEAAVRLLDLGASRYVVGATLSVLVSQRLARRQCPSCNGRDRGCADCAGSGYSGRRGVFEIQNFSGSLKDTFISGGGAEKLRSAAAAMGFKSLSDVSSHLSRTGEIAHEDALALRNWAESPLID